MSEYSLKPIQPTAQNKAEPVDPTISTTPITEKPHPKLEDSPISVEYFGVEGWGEMLLEPNLDVYGVKDKIVQIENFLKHRLTELKAKDTPETRKQILEQLERSLKISDLHKPHHRIDRVHSIIRYMDEFDSERERRNMLVVTLNKKFNK